jgi:DNA mismatch repair ATPase MutS
MSISNIEKINDKFKTPISYNDKKMELNKNIITDLELISTIDPSGISMYNYSFQPKTCFGKKVLEQLPTYYTTDKEFLKETQQILKEYKNADAKVPDFNEIMEIWDEIKNDTGFKERYHYIDWPMWEYLNKSEGFLQIMSVYNLTSPVISLFVPVIILIIPFFVIKIKGLPITINEYIDVLKLIASNHAIGKLFTKFNSVKTDEKIYLVISAAFYIFSIYQNILTCYRFHQNMHKIHSHLFKILDYLRYNEIAMNNILLYTSNMKTYEKFNECLREKLVILNEFKGKLEQITPYKLSINKCRELGNILKYFYEIYDNNAYNDAFLYSFGFHGYIDNINGLLENIQNKDINYVKFTNKKKKAEFKKSYYPALIKNKPVKNDYKLGKNMIITGPNASGKTTILKSALINVIISQQFGCGFYQKALLNPYKYIHCYLNIPDTSGRDSLFQAEARRCKDIIDIIHNNEKDTHFCVFDELYSGTNPDEAVMSALAFMQYLVKYENVNCILTTHFIKLCKQLETNKSVKNFHMNTEKHGKDFKYTYLLKDGISNIRGGFKVLSDMNYPKEILEKTENMNL